MKPLNSLKTVIIFFMFVSLVFACSSDNNSSDDDQTSYLFLDKWWYGTTEGNVPSGVIPPDIYFGSDGSYQQYIGTDQAWGSWIWENEAEGVLKIYDLQGFIVGSEAYSKIISETDNSLTLAISLDGENYIYEMVYYDEE